MKLPALPKHNPRTWLVLATAAAAVTLLVCLQRMSGPGLVVLDIPQVAPPPPVEAAPLPVIPTISENHGSEAASVTEPAAGNVLPWEKVESEDYPTYLANLRALGVPELTIRRIVTAELRQEYDQRRQEFLRKEPLPFWDTGFGSEETETPEFIAFGQRERAQLESLLGPSEEAPEEWSRESVDAGLMLGGTLATKAPEILAVETRDADARDAIIENAGNRPLTPAAKAQITRLDGEREAALLGILTPAQREDFELRNSPAGDAVRDDLREFNVKVNEDEFRQLYRARRDYLHSVEAAAQGKTSITAAWKRYLESASRILGPDRAFAEPE